MEPGTFNLTLQNFSEYLTRCNQVEQLRAESASKPIKTRKRTSEGPITIPDLMKRIVSNYGDHTALMCKDEVTKEWNGVNYKEYQNRVEKMAKVFIKLGLEKHGAVAVLASNSVEYFVSELAAIHACGTIADINTSNSVVSCYQILSTSKAVIVVVDDPLQLEEIYTIKDKLPHLKAIIQTMLLCEPVYGLWQWSELESMDTADVEDEYQRRLSMVSPNDCCCIVYAPETSENPKGVMLSHDNILFTCHGLVTRFDLQTRNETFLSSLPLSHVLGRVFELYLALTLAGVVYFTGKNAKGGSLVKSLFEVQPTFFVGGLQDYETIRATTMEIDEQSSSLKKSVGDWAKRITMKHHMERMAGQASNTIQYKLADKLCIGKVKALMGFQNCRNFLTSTASMTDETRNYFISVGIKILNFYGLSETSGVHCITSDGSKSFSTVGEPLIGMQTKIINKDANGSGEIFVRGRHVFMGYFGEFGKTTEVVDDEGWLRTGDVGYVNDEGYIFITSRIGNISPAPIENPVKPD